MERLSKKTVRMFDTVILIRKSRLRNLFLHLRRDDIMSNASCTRCGSMIHSRVKLDPEFISTAGPDTFHVICVGCSFEWVE